MRLSITSMHGLVPTVSQVLHGYLVNIAGFSRLHLSEENIGELRESHSRDLERLVTEKVKDVEVLKLTESVKALVKLLIAFIGLPKVFSICCESLKDILIAVCSYRSTQNSGHGVGGVATFPPQKTEDLALVAFIKIHQVVIILDCGELVLVPPQVLKV